MNNSLSVKNVIYSPEFVSRLIHRFISGACKFNDRGLKFELVYFLLPIVMNDSLRLLLKKVNVNSSFENIIINQENKSELIFMDEYIFNTKEVTNKGLIYLNSYIDVAINAYISVDDTIDFKSDSSILMDYYRASYYLGHMLAKEDYKNLYLKLGVTNI
ncbi:three component ABC system middle component [Vibrio anguillarum]|uniref:three component ABC system middle component n=1 Tax=Vibrio anguillarum TaxID=55601 RepID=UPI001C9CE832|nr:three component ABC system middle component [Vibrio anguillarum]MBY7667231.1 hypothetical protein [Vibrio anguillarum]